MRSDATLTLAHRLELAATLRQIYRDEVALALRLQARQAIAQETIKAQAAVCDAEDTVLRNLPTPLPKEGPALVAAHPLPTGRRLQLERFESVFAPVRLEHAEQQAQTLTGESTTPIITTPKPPRRTKQTGTEGGSP
jgi:ribosome biogenesis protein Tsr3